MVKIKIVSNEISDDEIDFILAAAKKGLDKKNIRKVIKSIRKAARKLKLKRDELYGVWLALQQMISKKENVNVIEQAIKKATE